MLKVIFPLRHKTSSLYWGVAGLILLNFGSAQATFKDVDTTHPYFHAIEFLEQKRVIEGYSEGGDERSFRPLQAVSRAEAVKILMSAVKNSLGGPSVFSDVPDQAWYARYVNAAAQQGIIQGYADGNFHPKAQVSRAEMLKMTLHVFEALPETSEKKQDWHVPLIKAGKEFRLINGSEPSPHESLSRGEVAEMIYRATKVAEKGFTEPYVYSGSGTTSFYGDDFHGRPTANGETYDKNALTAAHRTLPFNTWIKVSYKDKSVTVRVNDRGPYHKERIIDLSEAAFVNLAPISKGVLTVDFEVVKLPNEHEVAIPEFIRPQLSSAISNESVPESVVEKMQEKREEYHNTAPRKRSYFPEPRTHIDQDFFENITLRDSIPQKIYTGTVLEIAGTTDDKTPKKATIFFQKIRDDGSKTDDQEHFTGKISGNNFAIPVPFLHTGTFQIGLVLDDETLSRVGTIEVQSQERERLFPSSQKTYETTLQLSVTPEEKKAHLSWNKEDLTTLTKIIFSQGSTRKTLFIEGVLSEIELPYDFFHRFNTQQRLAIDLFFAESRDGSIEQQSTNWKKSTFENLHLFPGFMDKEKKGITVSNYKRFLHGLDPVRLRGKISRRDTTISDHAYVTLPSGWVEELSVKKGPHHAFSLNFTPKEFGTHIVEFVSDQGEVLFNKAVYIFPTQVLPVHIWNFVQPSGFSIPGFRHWSNTLRKKYGSGTLVADSELNRIAQAYAQQMAEENFLSHTSPSGLSFEQRMKKEKLPDGQYSENLSFGSTYQLALQGLENSGSHRRNLLLGKWKRIGLGIAQNEEKEIYLVQLFGK